MKKNILLLIISFLLYSCSKTDEDTNTIPVIDIEEGLSDFSQHILNEYATDIRYIRLENTPNSLINRNISKIHLENNKIFIHDSDPFLKVFDATNGKYLYNVGKKGQGPGELPFLYGVDINVKENCILLTWSKFCYKYDTNGNYIEQIFRPGLPWADSTNETIYQNISMLDDSIFSGGVVTYGDHQIAAAVVFDMDTSILNVLNSYRDYIQHPTIKVFSPFGQSGIFYRVFDEVHFFRSLSDTVYKYNPKEKHLVPSFCFNYGKHQSNFNFNPDTENPDIIKVQNICENNECVFIEFHTEKYSPEPFEDEIDMEGQIFKFINNNIYGIYNKKTQKLHFLLQPIPGFMGLKNNIDNGLPFWPVNISSNNELISYCHAFQFKERIGKLPNPDKKLVEMANQMDDDDNPVIIIATGKD